MSLDALLTWISFALAAVGVALAIYFFALPKRDGGISSAKTLQMGGEITRLRQTNERSERRRIPVHVLLNQPSRPESVNRPEFLSEVLLRPPRRAGRRRGLTLDKRVPFQQPGFRAGRYGRLG
jgi:hypothetical protein